MAGAIGQATSYGQGGLWDTNAQGVATPQAGRPVLSGGLQQMQMLQALRSGASANQLQAMNPYAPRPTQFLPQPLATRSYAPVQVQPASIYNPRGIAPVDMSGGPGGGDGSAASASSDGGQDGSSAAGGDGGGGGGGGSK